MISTREKGVSQRALWIVICAVLTAGAAGGALDVQSAALARPGSGAATPGAIGAPHKDEFGVGEIYVRYVDRHRQVRLPGGRLVPRSVLTAIRYPAAVAPGRVDVRGAPAVKVGGPFPLVVFGHGFAVTPSIYARLLRAWAAAGYVVAAPVFPLSNAHAPGGPNEADLVNQPGDMSLVITRILMASSTSHRILSHLIDAKIAVAGQSDGGSTALATAYNRNYADRRVRAAVILSGARIPGLGGYDFARFPRPLLAAQGTADMTNIPAATYHYYASAHHPKFLLSLFGAGHLPPYTTEQPQLGVVERVSTAFLDRYLKGEPNAGVRLRTAGNVPGVSTLSGG